MPPPWGSTPQRRAASRGVCTALRPSMSASPASGRSTVYSMRSVVDLPAPFGPRRPGDAAVGGAEADLAHRGHRPEPFGQRRASITAAVPLNGGEERQRHGTPRAAGIEPGDAGAATNCASTPVHARRGELAVAQALEAQRQAVRERARRRARVARAASTGSLLPDSSSTGTALDPAAHASRHPPGRAARCGRRRRGRRAVRSPCRWRRARARSMARASRTARPRRTPRCCACRWRAPRRRRARRAGTARPGARSRHARRHRAPAAAARRTRSCSS